MAEFIEFLKALAGGKRLPIAILIAGVPVLYFQLTSSNLHIELIPTEWVFAVKVAVGLSAALLITDVFLWLPKAIRSVISAIKQIGDDKQNKINLKKDIDENLLTLTELERVQLLWIFRNGTKRFDGSAQYTLVEKKIIFPTAPYSMHLFTVNDYAWSLKDEFIERHKAIKVPNEFPTSRNQWMGR